MASGVRFQTWLVTVSALALGCQGDPKLEVGRPAPRFNVESLAKPDQSVSLESLRGKVVVLNFWATWCGPCRSEMPELESIFDEGKAVVVSVTNESRPVAEAFRTRNQYAFPAYLDKFDEAWRAYGVDALPLTYIIGKDGKVVQIIRGYAPNALQNAVVDATAK